jgi:CHAT domain-containing protein
VTVRRPPGPPSTRPRRSESFELLVERVSGRRVLNRKYSVKLISSPKGGTLPGVAHSFSDKDLKALLGSGEAWRDLDPKDVARAESEEIGAGLFHALISKDIRRQWDKSLSTVRSQGSGLCLVLRLGAVPELEGWPWELLYDRSNDGFLALCNDTSIVRYLDHPTGSSPKKIALPLRVLVVVANPMDCDSLAGEEEWKRLNRALKPLADGKKVHIERLTPPTLSALQKAMSQRWHIVHFIGHGRFADGEGRLVLEDGAGRQEEVPGGKLKVLFKGQNDLRLVVLNSCVGAKASPENAFAGVAQSLASAGVPAVVAMRSRISDRAALTFAERFYESLAGDMPVDAAVSEARSAVHAGGRDLEWSTPVLYMRSAVDIIEAVKPWRAILAAALSVAALGGGVYWLSAAPDLSSDPACPSPPGFDVSFVKIEPGRFAMGTKGRQVEITHPYCLGKLEVTQRQWKQVMGPPLRQAKEGDNLPVGNVSWNDAEAFLSRLNAKEPAAHYRLPTEAQWEYAARAGTSSRFSFGDDASELRKYGNCHKSGEPTAIGQFQPNPWGLYDMYGNVSEWVEDWAGPQPAEPARDPTGPTTGTEKIRRGGSFTYSVRCNSIFQSPTKPEHRSVDTGFRIVRDPKP